MRVSRLSLVPDPAAFAVLLALAALPALLAAGCRDALECRDDVDCGAGRVCAANQCVQCATNADCADAEFCCQGVCRPAAEIDERCGCGASPQGSPGQSCASVEADSLCLVEDTAAVTANVAQGACGCGCTPEEGGPLCGAPAEPGGAPVCSCAENSDCRRASVDGAGRPHRVADTCTPTSTCVCFSLGTATACDPDGATPDCTSTGGCASLVDDPANCGVPARSCLDPATGIADTGACVGGGCLCDDAGDCGGAVNVNTCAFVAPGQAAQCVCAGYTAAGLQAACPMELECSANGCVLDGTAFATEESLRSALGLR